MEKAQTRPLSVLLDPPTYRRLVESAKQNSRSVSGEARHAIMVHLAKGKR